MILNPFIFRKEPNTFIGNAGATLSTKALLAAKLGFVNGGAPGSPYITNFHIDANNNISCHISRRYRFPNSSFRESAIPGISYFIDLDGKATRPAQIPPYGEANIFRGNTNFVAILPKFNQLSYNTFAEGSYDLISIPSHTPIGYDTTDNSVFSSASFTGNVYVNIANETNNGGNPDGDITGAVVPWIKYSSNSQNPSNPENITVTGKDSNSIQIEWDAISHTNAIDWYLVFANGVYKGKTASTDFDITGLDGSTDYEIKILAIDEMGNNSKFSESIVETTFVQEMQDVIDYAISESIAIPNHTKRVALNNLIKDAIDTGIWAKMDVFTNFAWNDVSLDDFSLIDYKRLSLMTVHGGMTYTINGWEGNGVDGYIDTSFNPATSGANYTLDNASFGAIVNDGGISGSPILGTSGTRNRIRSVSAADQRLNSSSNNLDIAYDFSGTGLKLINRDDDTNVRCISGSDEGARTQTSASIESTNQLIFRAGALNGNGNIACSMMGASITYAESQQLRTDYNAYLTAIGLTPIA